MIIRYAANWSVPYDRKLRSQTFIVQATDKTYVSLERFWSEWNSNFVLRVYFSPSRYEGFVLTQDAACGIFLPDAQKGLERERGI